MLTDRCLLTVTASAGIHCACATTNATLWIVQEGAPLPHVSELHTLTSWKGSDIQSMSKYFIVRTEIRNILLILGGNCDMLQSL